MLFYLEKILFYLFIFCLPLGTRKILYQFSDSFNEWTVIVVYLTDILLFFVFFLWFWRLRKKRFLKKGSINKEGLIKSPSFWLVLFLLIGFISLIKAENFWLGFYWWLRLSELVLLFSYIQHNLGRILNLKHLAQILLASGVIQAIIALLQYTNQKALGFWFLGESPLGIETAGVAKITVNNLKMIRAYGFLPHANVLAAFLFLCIFSLYYLWFSQKSGPVKKLSLLSAYGLLIIAICLTFSRLVISVFVLASLFLFVFWSIKKKSAGKIMLLVLVLSMLCLLLAGLAWPELSFRFALSSHEQAVSLRVFYNETALLVIKEHPWLGLGLGNFICEIRQLHDLLPAWVHQPAHNLYLLIAAETGLSGLFLFLMFVFLILKRISWSDTSFLIVLLTLCFLFLGLFDHYFWAIHQGQLMFWLVLGILARRTA